MDIVTYALLNGKIKDYASNVDEWLEENVDPATGYVLDRSLQMENAAAPADMVGDINDEVGDLKNTLNHKADVIYDTASGDIASFPDGADGLPVKDLTVAIEPVQSGTGDPSPTNVRPISGWTGANVITAGKNVVQSIANRTSNKRIEQYYNYNSGQVGGWPKLTGYYPAGTYTISMLASSSEGLDANRIVWTVRSAIDNKMYCVNSSGNFVNVNDNERIGFSSMALPSTPTRISKTVKINSPVKEIYLGFYQYGKYINYDELQLEFSSSFTAYDSDRSTTIPISWQSSAGTVYAASLDALAGSLKVRPYYASYNGETLVGPWISSMDAYTPGGTPTTGAQVVDFGGPETSYSLDAIALNTLLGQNNIWADCGPSTVEYQADTKLYIQKINAPTDDDMIADANIASGKYFIVNNNLYISTAAILAGDPIKPGTNCTLTNLAAALNALNS